MAVNLFAAGSHPDVTLILAFYSQVRFLAELEALPQPTTRTRDAKTFVDVAKRLHDVDASALPTIEQAARSGWLTLVQPLLQLTKRERPVAAEWKRLATRLGVSCRA